MKRLTFDGNFCDIAMCQETPGSSFCEDGYCTQRKVWDRLKQYEDMEEQGLLVRLPCKLGIPVYCLMGDGVYSETVEKICVSDMGFYLETENMGFDESDFGKYVFLTREEAKKALED